ncbi:MAG: prolyl oligopeptidase family serine peptidase, partial [Solirubrobacteraceae bacterium]
QAVAWERALRAHRVPVQLVTYPREPHGIGELRHQRDVLARVRDWFDRWLWQTR